ncbi:MAG: D-glycerate dehydrogenase [Proteobacteria bacterium]|nr:D-glycerate dehydrogenase [Pseudomonadota bacterium]
MKILITRKIPDNAIRILKENGFEIDYRQGEPLSKKDLISGIKDVEAIIAVIPDQIDREIIDSAAKLKIISCYSVGFDNIDYKYAETKKIITTNTPGHLTESVAEHSAGLMLAVARNIVMADYFVRQGKYKFWDPMIFLGPSLNGKTLGIIGMGRIGQHLAKIAHHGFGMKILYSDPVKCSLEKEFGGEFCNLEYVLNNSDFVSLNCLLSPETKHLISHKEFKMMKPTAFLINTSRGAVINENALIDALKNKIIAGAGLDVFEDENIVNPELYKLKNVVLTPHIASATNEARIEMAKIAAENIVDYLIKNQEPKFKVK